MVSHVERSAGATVVWEPEEMGWSLSVGSPVGKESAGGPSAGVTVLQPLSRSLPARPCLSASASGRSRAGRESSDMSMN